MYFDAVHLLLPTSHSSWTLPPTFSSSTSCPSLFLPFNNLLSPIRIDAYVCLITHWNMVHLLGATSLNRTDSPLSSYQLPIAAHLEVGLYETLPRDNTFAI